MEFALQERGDSGEWGQRILPQRRYFPNVTHTTWLKSTAFELSLPNVFAQIIARRTTSGQIEFGLQWVEAQIDGTQVHEALPRQRFFPEVDHHRWLNSSAIAIVLGAFGDIDALGVRTINVLRNVSDADDQGPIVARYRLDGGGPTSIGILDWKSPEFTIPDGITLYMEPRFLDGFIPDWGIVLIFPSGFELVLHPQTIDALLARTDITDPVAAAVVESMRQSGASRAGPATTEVTEQVLACTNVSSPFPTSTVEFPSDQCMHISGSGTLTIASRGRQLTLDLPDIQAPWLMIVIDEGSAGAHRLYIAPGGSDHLEVDWRTGAERSRSVASGVDSSRIHAVFDAIIASISR
ncbi:MAG: hypothetical protein OXN87_13890 [Chloroflexota bacterium]|nr:hypothetical protein [Chloroflexota bacterium]